jgi:Tol biopolymer transport system component
MGDVYRAKDERLSRIVAVKVLSEHLSDRDQSRQRFEREARAVAALQHPNICAVYDVGRDSGGDYIVMEFLQGETLAERLERGPLPPEQVARFGLEIASALDAAHRKGIVHRDLKPSNVMVVKSGTGATVKLLDFGVAKLGVRARPLEDTKTDPLTERGVVMGTCQYMAPEVFEGKEADARSDLFSLGAMLYEMAAGRRAFEGESRAAVVTKILTTEPPPLTSLALTGSGSILNGIERVVRTCLEKDPDDRWQNARDVAREFRWLLGDTPSSGGTAAPVETPRSVRRWREIAGWVVAAFAVASILLYTLWKKPPAQPVLRLAIAAPDRAAFVAADIGGPLQISPDGRKIAFVARDAEGRQMLWLRNLDSLDAAPLPGTDDAYLPFWSPDSRSVGFFAQGKLKTLDLSGGRPEALADAPQGRGASWSSTGAILFAPSTYASLFKVPAGGGEVRPVTVLDRKRAVDSQRAPVFLPDGEHFLFYQRSQSPDFRGIFIGSLEPGEPVRLLSVDSSVVYAPSKNGATGHLLYLREGALMAQPFDPASLRLSGKALAIAEHVGVAGLLCMGDFSVSSNGVVAYRTGAASTTTQLLWLDRQGKPISIVGTTALYRQPVVSPRGTQIAVERPDFTTGVGDIWLIDMASQVEARFTLDPAWDRLPVWSPDGNQIFYCTLKGRSLVLYRKPVDGGAEVTITESETLKWPTSWSPDSKYLLYDNLTVHNRYDVWMVSAKGGEAPRALVSSPYDDRHGQFSPDGRWLAYSSNQSGRWEVYVQGLDNSARWQVSSQGGEQPRWRADGAELYYLSLSGKLMAVPVRLSPVFQSGAPAALFDSGVPAYVTGLKYDVSPNGQRFLMNTGQSEAQSNLIQVVLNWRDSLGR